jgi:hypothetical protein
MKLLSCLDDVKMKGWKRKLIANQLGKYLIGLNNNYKYQNNRFITQIHNNGNQKINLDMYRQKPIILKLIALICCRLDCIDARENHRSVIYTPIVGTFNL